MLCAAITPVKGRPARLPTSGTSSVRVGAMTIVPLTPTTWPALAELFASGGDPTFCWFQHGAPIFTSAMMPAVQRASLLE